MQPGGAHLVEAGDVFCARADILTLLALPRAEVHADVRQGERLPCAGLSSQHRRDWRSDCFFGTERLFHQPKVLKEVGGYFNDKVYKTLIKRNVRLGESPSHGKPILLYDASSVGAQNYMELTSEILEKNE